MQDTASPACDMHGGMRSSVTWLSYGTRRRLHRREPRALARRARHAALVLLPVVDENAEHHRAARGARGGASFCRTIFCVSSGAPHARNATVRLVSSPPRFRRAAQVPLTPENVRPGDWVRVKSDVAVVKQLCEPQDDMVLASLGSGGAGGSSSGAGSGARQRSCARPSEHQASLRTDGMRSFPPACAI